MVEIVFKYRLIIAVHITGIVLIENHISYMKIKNIAHMFEVQSPAFQ